MWGGVGAPIIIFLFVAKSTPPHSSSRPPFSKLFWNIGHFPKHRRILDIVFFKGGSIYSFNIWKLNCGQTIWDKIKVLFGNFLRGNTLERLSSPPFLSFTSIKR